MSWHQDDGKKPVYNTTRGARGSGSSWLILGWPVEIVPLFLLLRQAWRDR